MSKNLTNTLAMLHEMRSQFAQPESPLPEKGYGSIKRANRTSRSKALEDDVADLMNKIDHIFEATGQHKSSNYNWE